MSGSARERVLDVSDLEAPEPLERVLTALGEMGVGDFLRMLHRREPLLLYPELKRRGFDYLMCLEGPGRYEVLIWRHGDAAAERACRDRAKGAPS